MAGSGGEQKSTSTVTQSNLPAYAKPYYTSMMSRAQAESTRPYQTYQGQRLAGISAATQQGFNMASNYANSSLGGVNDAMNLMGNNASLASQYVNYNPNTITNSYTGLSQDPYQTANIDSGQIGWAGNQPFTGVDYIGDTGVFDQAALDRYSSPYMQAVVDKAKEDAVRNYGMESTVRAGNAATAGAFGGSRAAVEEQLARNALQSNLTDIQVKGSQSAFENAQQQFERDRAARLQAATANQNAGLSMAQSNQKALLDAQNMMEQSRQFGYGQSESAAQKAAELGLQAQTSTEQFRQSGAELGLKGLDLSTQNAKSMVDAQNALDTMMQNRVKMQLGVGQAQEEYKQQQLDQAYNDFVNQRDAQRQNLQFLSSILRGVPISANTDVTTSQATNPLAGLLGSASGLAALQGLMQQ